MELIIGSHVSYKNDSQLLGSVKEAISYGENTFMFYTGAPQNTRRGAIHDELTYQAYQLMKENETYRQIALSQLSEKELSEYKENKDGKEE